MLHIETSLLAWTQWAYVHQTEKLSPPLQDAVKGTESNGVLCCSNSDIMTETNLNSFETVYFDIKSVSLEHYT